MGKELSEMSLEELWELFPIILKEHNKEYKEWYQIEKDNLINCIGKQNIKRLSHIGSSAVWGLISKPTVDILLEIDEECDVHRLKNILKNAGWCLMSSNDEPMKMVFNKGYTPNGFAEKVYHLHVRYFGDHDELYFRDYLLEHGHVSHEYGQLKLSLLEKYRHNRDGYTEAKTEFVRKHTKLAREEFGDRYLPQK